MSLTVVVDRDAVAMGDDAVAHGQSWTMPDETRVSDVVSRVVADRFLPEMTQAVWTLTLFGPARVVHEADGRCWIRDGLQHPLLALVTGDQPRDPIVVSTSRTVHPHDQLAGTGFTSSPRSYALKFGYLSDALWSWDRFIAR